MTRKEKETLLLAVLDLKAGDMIEVLGPVICKGCRFYNIVEKETYYTLVPIISDENSFDISDGNIFDIFALVYWDFKKVKQKKRKGDLTCNETVCEDCPLNANRCQLPMDKDTIYDILEKTNEVYPMPDKVYEAYRSVLDEEVE